MKVGFTFFFALLFLVQTAIASATHKEGTGHAHHRFRDTKYWARKFDDPKREDWQKPGEVIAALDLKPDTTIADIGAGTGYFSFRMANSVPKGKVFAADIEKEMVQYLQQQAQKKALTNVEAVLLSASEPKLPEPSDIALMVNTYHHISDRTAYFRSLQKSLKANGKLAIIDFNGTSKIGPPIADRVSPEIAKEEIKAAGYRLIKEFDFLPNQYFLVFQR